MHYTHVCTDIYTHVLYTCLYTCLYISPCTCLYSCLLHRSTLLPHGSYIVHSGSTSICRTSSYIRGLATTQIYHAMHRSQNPTTQKYSAPRCTARRRYGSESVRHGSRKNRWAESTSCSWQTALSIGLLQLPWHTIRYRSNWSRQSSRSWRYSFANGCHQCHHAVNRRWPRLVTISERIVTSFYMAGIVSPPLRPLSRWTRIPRPSQMRSSRPS